MHQSATKRCERCDPLGKGTARLDQTNRHSRIDAFQRRWLFVNVEYLLAVEHGFHVVPMQNASREPPSTAVDRDGDLSCRKTLPAILIATRQLTQRGATCSAHRRQRFNGLPKARNCIQAGHDHAVRGRHHRISPCEPGDGQIDQDQVVALRREIEECVNRRDPQVAKIQLAARRGKRMQPACMTADEDIKELSIEPFRVIQNFLNLETRLDVEIVANVTSLEIQVDDAYGAVAGGLGGLELDGDLERERSVADAASAWDE